MDTLIQLAHEFVTHNQVIATVLVIILGVGARWLIQRHFRNMPRDEDGVRLRWLNSARKIVNLLVVTGVIIIWLSELRFVALSIATFIVALVIATREFIQCFVGSLYQASTRTFAVGDWIRIGEQAGEVVASDWLSTTLLQVDMTETPYSYTGRTVIVPNNQFVGTPIHNLNHMRRYVAHTFMLTRDAGIVNMFDLRDTLLRKAEGYCSTFRPVAERYSALIEKKLGVSILGPAATIRVSTSPLGKDQMIITIFCPTQKALEIEQLLTRDFMALWHERLRRQKEVGAAGLSRSVEVSE